MTGYRQQVLTPHNQILEELSQLVWSLAQETDQAPLVILTTAGPAHQFRKVMNRCRPEGLKPHLVFLPRIIGLRQWLDETPALAKTVSLKSPLERLQEVYSVLSRHPDLQKILAGQSQAACWAVAQHIIDACDLLTDATCLTLEDAGDLDKTLLKVLGQVYLGEARHAIDLETNIILEFWKNLTSLGDPVVRARYAMQARSLEASKPLIFIRTAKGSAAQERALDLMLQQYGQTQTVIDVCLSHQQMALWPEVLGADIADVQNNREIFFKQHDNRHIYCAKGFEEAAWVGAHAIQDFLKQGSRQIALVAQDRLLARRVRALLARSKGLAIHDETGWKLATTRAAASVMSWFDVVRAGKKGPGAIVLMDFLKSPLIDWSAWQVDAEEVSSFLERFEKVLVARQVQSGWQSIEQAFASSELANQVQLDRELHLIQSLRACSDRWHRAANSLADWRNLVLTTLQELGMLTRLSGDYAGAQWLTVLDPMKELHQNRVAASEFLALMYSLVEDAVYIEDVTSGSHQVVILPLSATRIRRFDAWVMVGCDDTQLPSVSQAPLFLSNELRKHIGMKSQEDEFVAQATDLSQLMMTHTHWAMVWQGIGESGEVRQPSGWLQRLYAQTPDRLSKVYPIQSVDIQVNQQQMPRPTIPLSYPKPLHISPSAYKTLRECPYRFFVTKILHLSSEEILDEDVDSRVLGQLLHGVLRSFYQELQSRPVQNEDREQLELRLRQHSEKAFNQVTSLDAVLLGAYLEWCALIPSWIDWHLQRLTSGWTYLDGERFLRTPLNTRFGDIDLVGQLDRIDQSVHGGLSVLDYKYSKPDQFNKRLKMLSDDPQLLLYAFLLEKSDILRSGQYVAQAAWVSLKDQIKNREIEDIESKVPQTLIQLKKDIEAVWAGKPMLANGPEQVCRYCESRGLCRKGVW